MLEGLLILALIGGGLIVVPLLLLKALVKLLVWVVILPFKLLGLALGLVGGVLGVVGAGLGILGLLGGLLVFVIALPLLPLLVLGAIGWAVFKGFAAAAA